MIIITSCLLLIVQGQIIQRRQDDFDSSEFSVESQSPFVPVLSGRQSKTLVETPRSVFQQINFQMQQALSRHQEAINNHQRQVQNALAGAGGKTQSPLSLFLISKTTILTVYTFSVSRQSLISHINRFPAAAPGPVSITLETPAASIPLSPGLGGVLVANEQVLGPPCLAR